MVANLAVRWTVTAHVLFQVVLLIIHALADIVIRWVRLCAYDTPRTRLVNRRSLPLLAF
jgi:hypothetical protein